MFKSLFVRSDINMYAVRIKSTKNTAKARVGKSMWFLFNDIAPAISKAVKAKLTGISQYVFRPKP